MGKFRSSFSPAIFPPRPCATSPCTTAFISTSQSSSRELTQAIEKLLTEPPNPLVVPPRTLLTALSVSGGSRIIVVDDDDLVREAIRAVLEDDGRVVETYASCETFLEGFHSDRPACLLIDAYLPAMSGLELLEKLHDDVHSLPTIMITGNGDVPMAVKAMKAGALDFIEKPIGREELIASIDRALELSHDSSKLMEWRGIRSDSPRGSHAATARGDGKGARRPPEQEHCCRSRHQSAHGREPPRLHHEKNRVEVAARVGQIGAYCLGWREEPRQAR